jgi:hypothetical protein
MVFMELQTELKLASADLDDPFLRKAQRKFDEQYFDQYPYSLELKEFPNSVHISHADAKVDHIAKHVAKALGKLHQVGRTINTPQSPMLNREVLPDLLIYRTQLANTLRYNLEKRLGGVMVRGRTLTEAGTFLHKAHHALFNFTEPLEHGMVDKEKRDEVRSVAIGSLHASAMILARLTRSDPQTVHAIRLCQLMADAGAE